MIEEYISLNLVAALAIFYFSNAIFFWRIECAIQKSAVDIINASKQVRRQKELLEKAKSSKSVLRYIFWPVSLFK